MKGTGLLCFVGHLAVERNQFGLVLMAMKVCTCIYISILFHAIIVSDIYNILLLYFLTVPDLVVFANSSFTNINGRRELNQGLSVLNFRQLFSFRTTEENVQGVFLTSYFNGPSDSDFILPNSNIGGTYTCKSGNQSQNVSVNLRSIRINLVMLLLWS